MDGLQDYIKESDKGVDVASCSVFASWKCESPSCPCETAKFFSGNRCLNSTLTLYFTLRVNTQIWNAFYFDQIPPIGSESDLFLCKEVQEYALQISSLDIAKALKKPLSFQL